MQLKDILSEDKTRSFPLLQCVKAKFTSVSWLYSDLKLQVCLHTLYWGGFKWLEVLESVIVDNTANYRP